MSDKMTNFIKFIRCIFHRNEKKSVFLRNCSTIRKISVGRTFLAKKEYYKNVSEKIYDVLKDPQSKVLLMPKFMAELERLGILYDDPRLKQTHKKIEQFKKEHREVYYKGVNFEQFSSMTYDCHELIAQAFLHQFVVTNLPELQSEIGKIYEKCMDNRSGLVADYIPQLAKVPQDSWAVSVCTIDGQRFNFGDASEFFTIQSCSKPITYAIALNFLGTNLVHSYVGKEPSGRMFNELILNFENKPHNPMINPGAILVCSLIQTLIDDFGEKPSEVFENTKQIFKRLGGDFDLGFNTPVYISEQEAANRNYAIAFYLKEHKCFPMKSNMLECMKFYFRCCSLEFNTKILAVVAATLANSGTCPLTNDRVFKPEIIKNVLSLMYSCGMYDYSGEFAFDVGLPAKSGVSGALMIVIPDVMGIALWSPRLERMGNSERGVQFCQELVKKFNFHKYDSKKLGAHQNKVDPREKGDEIGHQTYDLLRAAASGNLDAIRMQFISGTNISLKDYDGRSALHLASCEGHRDCVEFLLRNGHFDPNAPDRWGNTPISEAEKYHHQQVAALLKGFKPAEEPKEKSDTKEKVPAEKVATAKTSEGAASLVDEIQKSLKRDDE